MDGGLAHERSPPPAPRLAGGADRGRRGVVRGCPLLTADLGWFAAPARPGWASGSVWSRTPPALRSSATRDRSAGRARQGRYKLGHEHILIRKSTVSGHAGSVRGEPGSDRDAVDGPVMAGQAAGSRVT